MVGAISTPEIPNLESWARLALTVRNLVTFLTFQIGRASFRASLFGMRLSKKNAIHEFYISLPFPQVVFGEGSRGNDLLAGLRGILKFFAVASV
jgi:hypothetical protein